MGEKCIAAEMSYIYKHFSLCILACDPCRSAKGRGCRGKNLPELRKSAEPAQKTVLKMDEIHQTI